jgi:hypothetical protein
MNDSLENIDSYLKNRVEQYRQWYDLKAIKMKRYYIYSRVSSALSAVLIPMVVNIEWNITIAGILINGSNVIVTILGTLVAVLIALEGVLHHREQWKNYRTTEQYLETQKQLFIHNVGDYSDLDKKEAFKLLISRVESSIAEENSTTLNVLTRVNTEAKKTVAKP